MKICVRCKQERLLDHFTRDNTKRDGRRAVCKHCANKRGIAGPRDYAGIKVGLLTFISATDQVDAGGRRKWKLICDCGNLAYLAPGNVIKKTSRGTTSCGCVQKGINKFMHDPQLQGARSIWSKTYQECNWEIFLKLSKMPCYYCGSLPYRKRDGYVYNGLDRIDSSSNHNENNVVPSCWTCNRMKGDLSVKDFYEHIKKILSASNSL